MKQFFQSFKNKKFRYGAFSTLTAIFIIAILVVINLVVGQMDIKFDLTADKKYSLSQESKDIINGITEDITIYALFKTGEENTQFKELLDQYASTSPKIKIEYKDPYLYPLFVEKYKQNDTEIPANSIIVESSKRFKVIRDSEMLTYDYNYETFQSYIKSIDIEPQITNALKYVSDENTSVIYKLTGHNEIPLDETFIKQITLANYEFKELDLFTEEKVPDDASVLFITTPARDYTVDEAKKITDYLQNNGRAIFFLDYVNTNYENLRKIINSYGVDVANNIIFEGNQKYVYQNMPNLLIPTQIDHDITIPLKEKNTYPNLIPNAMAIQTLDIKKNSLKIEPLLVTSNESYAKKNLDTKSINKEATDEKGPFNIALAITDSTYTDKQFITKLVVIGSSNMLEPSINQYYVGGSNGDFVLNSINWLHDKNDSVYITPKLPNSFTNLMINQETAIIIMLFSIIILPAIIFVTGLVIWLRRRNR